MKKLKKTRYQYILIIGNGFDLDLGLPTRYSDFLDSKFFERLISDTNDLAKHLKSINELNNWIDIEEELKKYSLVSKDPKKFLADYKALCNCLLEYIGSINCDNINKDSTAFKLINDILKADNVLIIDFNYTNSLNQIITKAIGSTAIKDEKIEHIKIHGGIDEGNIIFGVEDGARINKEHIFLKKSSNKIFNPIDFSSAIEKCDSLVFFGHSLGATDHMYFDDYFPNAVINFSTPRVGSEKQNIILFHYGEDNYYSLIAELDILTRQNLKNLKEINNFKMIEVKK